MSGKFNRRAFLKGSLCAVSGLAVLASSKPRELTDRDKLKYAMELTGNTECVGNNGSLTDFQSTHVTPDNVHDKNIPEDKIRMHLEDIEWMYRQEEGCPIDYSQMA